MMSIEAVLPAIGGIGIRLIWTGVRFAVTGGSNVGAGVVPTGKLAWAAPLWKACVVHGEGLAATVAGAAEDGAASGVPVVLHEIATRAAVRMPTAERR